MRKPSKRETITFLRTVACVVHRAILKSWSPWHHNAASGCACLKPITSIYSSIPLFPLACEGKCQFTACLKKKKWLFGASSRIPYSRVHGFIECIKTNKQSKHPTRSCYLVDGEQISLSIKYIWKHTAFTLSVIQQLYWHGTWAIDSTRLYRQM